jgi:integrase
MELQLPLSDMALAIVDQLPVVGESGLVFPAPRSDKPLRIEQRTKAKLDKLSGVTGWQLRDIRRTCRTLMARVGVKRDIAERVLGHVVGSKVERTYDHHSYTSELRVAVSALAREVDRILTGETAKVVGFR